MELQLKTWDLTGIDYQKHGTWCGVKTYDLTWIYQRLEDWLEDKAKELDIRFITENLGLDLKLELEKLQA